MSESNKETFTASALVDKAETEMIESIATLKALGIRVEFPETFRLLIALKNIKNEK